MKRITELHAYEQCYIICKDDNGYWGINTEMLDENGCLKQQINGIQGNLSETLADCISQCRAEAKVKHLVGTGLTIIEAIQQVHAEMIA